MGYRRLLKSYLQHIDGLLGTTLVDTANAANGFSKRDLGELNAIAAELAREAFVAKEQTAAGKASPRTDYGDLLTHTIRGFGFSAEQAADIIHVDLSTMNRWCYSDVQSLIDNNEAIADPAYFTWVICQLIAHHRLQHSSGDQPAVPGVMPEKPD